MHLAIHLTMVVEFEDLSWNSTCKSHFQTVISTSFLTFTETRLSGNYLDFFNGGLGGEVDDPIGRSRNILTFDIAISNSYSLNTEFLIKCHLMVRLFKLVKIMWIARRFSIVHFEFLIENWKLGSSQQSELNPKPAWLKLGAGQRSST